MKHDEVTCQRLILVYLVDYEDGTMPEPDRRQLEEHFSHCPPCVEFLDSYRATGRTLKMLKPRDVPKNLADAVIRFVSARCKK